MQEGYALPGISKFVTQDQINRYAEVSGDNNPVHLDFGFAVETTFGRIVAHGMLVLAFVSEMLTRQFGQEWLETGTLKVRLKAPVYPGDSVLTYGVVSRLVSESGVHRVQCDIGCRKADGQEVMTGVASLLLSDLSMG
jgi:3-hydroxybutyryl-CoA dehydratase